MGSVTGRHEQSQAVNGEAPAGGGSAGEFIQRREILCYTTWTTQKGPAGIFSPHQIRLHSWERRRGSGEKQIDR